MIIINQLTWPCVTTHYSSHIGYGVIEEMNISDMVSSIIGEIAKKQQILIGWIILILP